MSDDVITKHIKILLNGWTQILNKILTVLHEVRINVVLQSTYSIIVLNQTSTGGLLHAVQHMLTIAHAIQEGSQSTQVLSHTRGVEQVGVETLKLIHDSTDVLDTISEFYTHTFLNHTYQSMAMLHGSQIVKTIC